MRTERKIKDVWRITYTDTKTDKVGTVLLFADNKADAVSQFHFQFPTTRYTIVKVVNK